MASNVDRVNNTFSKNFKKTRKLKAKNEKIQTTLTAKHHEILNELEQKEATIPMLNQRIHDIQQKLNILTNTPFEKLTKEEISLRLNSQREINDIQHQINNIKQQRTNYFLKNGNLIFEYNRVDKQHTKVIAKTSIKDIFKRKKIVTNNTDEKNKLTKVDYLCKFLSNVDPNFVNNNESKINQENYCQNCQCFRVLKSNEAKMICPNCGVDISIIMESDKPSLKDPPRESRHYDYRRIGHFCDWLAKLQGKENVEIPQEVINAMLVEIKRKRIRDLTNINDDTIKAWLKKHGHQSFSNNATQILFKINNIPPLSLTTEQEEQYIKLFMDIQEPYELYRPDSRTNFSSYPYIIYKFSQLLGYNDVKKKLKLLKSKEKCYELDAIWKKICKALGGETNGWKYIRS